MHNFTPVCNAHLQLLKFKNQLGCPSFSPPFIFNIRADAINKTEQAIVYITLFSLFNYYSERFLPNYPCKFILLTLLSILYYVANKCLVAVTVT